MRGPRVSSTIPLVALILVAAVAVIGFEYVVPQKGADRDPERIQPVDVHDSVDALGAWMLDLPPEAAAVIEDASPAQPLLGAILQLEQSNDPKCHSTACRFEDFIYGTPLTAEGRHQRTDLQKQFIRQVWTAASRDARAAGEPLVTRSRVVPLIEQILETTTAPDGVLIVRLTGETVNISPVRARQFASIAYSLRALVGVQQDALVGAHDPTDQMVPAVPLVPLNDESAEALRVATDMLTLCALKLADQAARKHNEATIGRERLRAAWRRCVGDRSDGSAIASSEHGEAARGHSAALFATLVDNKIAAYLSHLEISREEAARQFIANMQVYYALFRLPTRPRYQDEFRDAYKANMLEFAGRLLEEADRRAESAGHSLIRAGDADRAVAALVPHEIDDFEDMHFFHHLRADESVILESYDCDSYRDTGLHWSYLKDACEGTARGLLVPDPFAAEIIAEAISMYGVLLPRVAGRIARASPKQPFALRSEYLDSARFRIVALARKHDATPPPAEGARGIVSASSEPLRSDRTYFTDVTAESGVEFVHRSTKWLSEFRRTRRKPPTFSGGGVAADDVNNDGSPDLLFVGGIGNALYLNDGSGRFRDVTAEAGIAYVRPDGTHGEARQPLIADFDNDGWPDILITYNNDDHRLYRGIDGVRFEDVTTQAGLGGSGLVGGPATTFDFDNDGLLDLYLCYFGDYLNGATVTVSRGNANALPNRLFRNMGSMRFRDVTEGSGAADTGWCQGVSHTDFDRDGRADIVVANDFGYNTWLRNTGGGRFEDVSRALGLSKAYHSMNVGITDLNRDGYPDVYISNIATMVKDNTYTFPDVNTPVNFAEEAMANMLVKEANVLYMSQAGAGGLERYEPSGDIERGESSTGWAWDAEFFDFDLDGDDDLYVVNGTNDYNLYFATIGDRHSETPVYYHLDYRRESNVFYVNEGGKLRNRSSLSGADFRGNSRSTAYLDWDGDGDLDIAVSNFHAPATMLRNNSEDRGNNWVTVRLIGDPAAGSNRDAIGAHFVATNAEGLYLLREIQGGSGYMSANPKKQYIGLGRAGSVDLQITWPNGDTQTVTGLSANRGYTIRQSDGDDEKS